jgi:hypothetical protein
MCKTALAYDTRAGNGMPSAHDAAGRLVHRRPSRDSRLIVKTSPRIMVNWQALASSILEDSGPVFTTWRCGAISPVSPTQQIRPIVAVMYRGCRGNTQCAHDSPHRRQLLHRIAGAVSFFSVFNAGFATARYSPAAWD